MGIVISDILTAADEDSDFLKSETVSTLNIDRHFEGRWCLYLQSKIMHGEISYWTTVLRGIYNYLPVDTA